MTETIIIGLLFVFLTAAATAVNISEHRRRALLTPAERSAEDEESRRESRI
jgi:cell division protein FtsL